MKISVQSGTVVYDYGFSKGYRMLREAGFEAIDWNIDNLWEARRIRSGDLSGHCYLAESFEATMEETAFEREQIVKNGLAVTQAHAPFPAYVFGCPESLDYAIGVYKNCIRLCDAVGCKNLIIHGITPPAWSGRELHELADECNEKLYRSLIPTLLDSDVTVCLENLFVRGGKILRLGVCSDPHEAADCIDRYNALAGKDCFGFCLDTGHLNLLHGDFYKYITILGGRIKALHIHDNDGQDDEHLAPFTGSIDWENFCMCMREIGYTGDLSFETFRQTALDNVLDERVTAAYLHTIRETGAFFRERILGNA